LIKSPCFAEEEREEKAGAKMRKPNNYSRIVSEVKKKPA